MKRLPAFGLTLSLALAPTAAGQQCPVLETQHLIPADYLSLPNGIFFGQGLAVDDDRLLVGAIAHPPGGGAYVFERAGPAQPWFEVGQVVPTVIPQGEFGMYLDLDGDRCVVGTPHFDGAGPQNAGAAFVFERGASGTWDEVARLFASNAYADLELGEGVALSGDTIAVGARRDKTFGSSSGAVYVFELDPSGTWTEVALLYEPDPAGGEYFGETLVLEGDLLVVGSDDDTPFDDGGAAFAFERDAGGPSNWGLVQELAPAELEEDDFFGNALSLSGDLLAVGAFGDDDNGPDTGALYVYERPSGGGPWTQIAKVLHETPVSPGAELGRNVALDGDWLAAGVASDWSFLAPNGGSGYVFHRDQGGPGNWGEVSKVIGSDPWPYDDFGRTVALQDGTVLFGAPYHAHWFTNLGGVWAFEATPPAPSSYCTAGTTASGCQASVSAAGSASRSQSSGFVVDVSGVEGQKDGTLYFGTSGAQANPWGNGSSLQCVVPPVVRTGVLQGSGAPNTCQGSLQLDFNAWMAAHASKAPAAGVQVRMQSWFRDPLSTSNQSTSLSDAIQFTVCP